MEPWNVTFSGCWRIPQLSASNSFIAIEDTHRSIPLCIRFPFNLKSKTICDILPLILCIHLQIFLKNNYSFFFLQWSYTIFIYGQSKTNMWKIIKSQAQEQL